MTTPLSSRHPIRFLLFTLALAVVLASAHAETTTSSGATAITASTTISTSGTYYLSSDLTSNLASGNFITVNASNVTIDLNGHTIKNTYGAATSASGIRSTGYANIAVRNGTISGFYYGLRLTGSSPSVSSDSYGHVLDHLNLLTNFCCAVSIQGVYCRVYQCRAVLTGGTSAGVYYGFLFDAQSNANSVEDCDVCGMTSNGSGTNTSFGIDFVNGADNFAVNNRLSGLTKGIVSGASPVGMKYRDNLTSGVTTTYVNGTAVGTTNN